MCIHFDDPKNTHQNCEIPGTPWSTWFRPPHMGETWTRCDFSNRTFSFFWDVAPGRRTIFTPRNSRVNHVTGLFFGETNRFSQVLTVRPAISGGVRGRVRLTSHIQGALVLRCRGLLVCVVEQLPLGWYAGRRLGEIQQHPFVLVSCRSSCVHRKPNVWCLFAKLYWTNC